MRARRRSDWLGEDSKTLRIEFTRKANPLKCFNIWKHVSILLILPPTHQSPPPSIETLRDYLLMFTFEGYVEGVLKMQCFFFFIPLSLNGEWWRTVGNLTTLYKSADINRKFIISQRKLSNLVAASPHPSQFSPASSSPTKSLLTACRN